MQSLENGPTRPIVIRCPESLRTRVTAALRDGETISEVTRRAWEVFADRRLGKEDAERDGPVD